MLPRHPMTKGRIRLSPWNPIEQGAFLLPPLHPHRPTLRGLDVRQPHRGWIATGDIIPFRVFMALNYGTMLTLYL